MENDRSRGRVTGRKMSSLVSDLDSAPGVALVLSLLGVVDLDLSRFSSERLRRKLDGGDDGGEEGGVPKEGGTKSFSSCC